MVGIVGIAGSIDVSHHIALYQRVGLRTEGVGACRVVHDPSDSRIICTGLTIDNNLITDVTNEDWGCVGIGAGFVRDIRILHNEISEVSYSGISMGWGWNQQPCAMADNRVKGNLIHHYAKHMYDTAGIYTLGAQPHSFVEENVVRDIYSPGYAHDPNHWFYLYTDEGSSCIMVRNNWTPTEKYLKNATRVRQQAILDLKDVDCLIVVGDPTRNDITGNKKAHPNG